jgi:hypothetical protein
MSDLPLVTRWTANAKRDLVAKVAHGEIALEEACRRYRLSVEEFADWQRDYSARETERAR